MTWERRGNQPTDVDKLWLDTVNIGNNVPISGHCNDCSSPPQMLLLIGEAFEETDLINGVVVNIRKMEKICEWKLEQFVWGRMSN